MINREQAVAILHHYTRTDNLRKHALAVEAAMRACARKFEGNEEEWGIVGLLHDFDYEMHPTIPDHPMKGSAILATYGVPEHLRRTIVSHVPQMNIPRDSLMAKSLFACDELSGFIIACALVRPNRLADLTASSVKKKMKDKAFARTVSREDIHLGMEELGVTAEEHFQFVIEALREISHELGM